MENIEVTKNKKPRRLKTILIITFIIISILAVSLIYFKNETFKLKVNKYLGKIPGAIGENFSSSPVDAERNDKKADLANYYLSLDSEAAADKLYIIKKDDEKLYSEIIRLMNSNSSSKTGDIIKLVRDIELRKDLLSSIHDEIHIEKENELLNEVNRLENQELLVTKNEIENNIENKEKLSNIFMLMEEDKAKDILYYIDDDIREDILLYLPDAKRTSLESKLAAKKMELIKLSDLATLYEVKPVEEIIEEVGNTNKYSVKELGIIYKNFSVLKSAEVLSKIEDDNFVQQLLSAIRNEEELNDEEESITDEINNSIQFITEYNRKIDDLVTVYNKMSPDKVAKIVEQMMKNDTTVTALEINSEPVFEISDSSIIIDVLSRMKNKTLSSIMDYMGTEGASMLTQALARP